MNIKRHQFQFMRPSYLCKFDWLFFGDVFCIFARKHSTVATIHLLWDFLKRNRENVTDKYCRKQISGFTSGFALHSRIEFVIIVCSAEQLQVSSSCKSSWVSAVETTDSVPSAGRHVTLQTLIQLLSLASFACQTGYFSCECSGKG